MEKQLIEQLLSNGLSIKKLKDIVENLDAQQPEQHSEQSLNTTTTANTCGLRIIKCGSCNKKFYEDKFMLNRLNKRYRSCIHCIMRQRRNRQKTSEQVSTNDILFNTEPDTQDLIHMENETPTPTTDLIELNNEEAFNIEPSTNLIDYPNIEQKHEFGYHIEPNIDISNFSHIEPFTKPKHESKKNNNNVIPLQFPEPSDFNVGIRNLFRS